jgi:hypothetical protein
MSSFIEWNWWALAVIPVAWFLQNIIHEGGHLFVAWENGWKVKGFWPYPHKWNGRWYFARCQWSRMGPSSGWNAVLKKVCISPFFTGLMWAVLCSLAIVLVPSWLRIFGIPFVIAGLFDAGFFWWGYFWGSEMSDGRRYRYRVNKEGKR